MIWGLIWKILEFGTKVLIRIREVQFLNKNCLTYSFFRYWKRVEAGLVDKELYASWLGSVNFDAISKLICGPSRVIYALFAHYTGLLEIFFFCHNQMSFKRGDPCFILDIDIVKSCTFGSTMTKQVQIHWIPKHVQNTNKFSNQSKKWIFSRVLRLNHYCTKVSVSPSRQP